MTEKPLRVLLVEDSPTDAKLVLREIRAAGHVVEFERVEDAPSMRTAESCSSSERLAAAESFGG